jgi:hypothetical protein
MRNPLSYELVIFARIFRYYEQKQKEWTGDKISNRGEPKIKLIGVERVDRKLNPSDKERRQRRAGNKRVRGLNQEDAKSGVTTRETETRGNGDTSRAA